MVKLKCLTFPGLYRGLQPSKLDIRRPKYRIDELTEPPFNASFTWWGLVNRRNGFQVLIVVTGCICGPMLKGIRNEDLDETRSSFGVQEINKSSPATKLTTKALFSAAATDSTGCHHDSILPLASVELNQRLVISSSRDGAIKVDLSSNNFSGKVSFSVADLEHLLTLILTNDSS
ncbi:hypothetical protein C5167_031035 [Papaver somniferum]|nr:hypothetical protein C5167_031035 [Papaver somniferum]